MTFSLVPSFHVEINVVVNPYPSATLNCLCESSLSCEFCEVSPCCNIGHTNPSMVENCQSLEKKALDVCVLYMYFHIGVYVANVCCVLTYLAVCCSSNKYHAHS